ncbi:MAG: 3,4-dihydroxy-2-butanone-4-phosphate synthase, partial [Bacteroidota bacterium]
MADDIRFDSVPDAVEDIRNGKLVVVVDDEDRENEGDFVTAAEVITPDLVNFMARWGRGLMCVPLTRERSAALELPMMEQVNTSLYDTPFTVSVDLREGTTTGISAADRAATIRALADPDAKPSDFARPGHIFPLRAQTGGVLRRTGHTEATVDLARLAGFRPVGVLIEVMNEDGTMARVPDLRRIADEHGLKLITIQDLIAYRMRTETLVQQVVQIDLPTDRGAFELAAYEE